MTSEKKIDDSFGDDHREFRGDPVEDQRTSDEAAHADLQIGSERRTRIEKRLKRKLDARFSILVSVVPSVVTGTNIYADVSCPDSINMRMPC